MVNYELKRSRRRTIAIHVNTDGSVEVRAPYLATRSQIERFVLEKESWIEKTLAKIKEREQSPIRDISPEEKKRLMKQAHNLIPARVAYYAPIVGVSYNRIAIRDTKTRWGSCSKDGNLNYSFRLVKMPLEILDYVIVHELCHRIHMNHSKEFWAEVERVLPDYKERRKYLKTQ